MRNRYVDRLRGLSIVLVAMFHSSGLLPWVIKPFPNWFVILVLRNGGLGVAMFFAISGFLITNKVLQPGASKDPFSTWSFYSQRIGRILPCLVLMCTLGVAFCLLGIPGFTFDRNKLPLWELLTYIFTFRFNVYLVNHAGLPHLWDVLWSLSIEEVFYLSFPILFGVVRRKSFIVSVLLIVVAVGPVRRALLGHIGLYDYFGCFDQIALGSLAAFVNCGSFFGKLPKGATTILRWGSVTFIGIIYFKYWIEKDFVFLPSLVALGAAIYLTGSGYGRWQAPRGAWKLNALELCGPLSYEMYLFHMFLLLGMTKIVLSMLTFASAPMLSYVANAVFFVLLVALALIISKTFSEPSNRALRRLLMKMPLHRSGKKAAIMSWVTNFGNRLQ